MSQFLLPCSCGERLSVGANQAGELIHCRCGQTVEVPTLRELNRLERAADRTAPPAAAWSKRQGMILLGAVIAVLSMGPLTWLMLHRPPTEEEVLANIATPVDRLTPKKLWEGWDWVSAGIAVPLSREKAGPLADYLIRWKEWKIFFVASLVLLGIGVSLIVTGLALPRRQPRAADPGLQ